MNKEFLEQMQSLLQDEYPAYLKCLEEKPYRGFRVNLLKTDINAFLLDTKIDYQKSPYADNGYYTETQGIGSMPAYLAGTFYMQEPSASAAVTVLDPRPNMKVLDLCAAPGSKTTQILEKLQNKGLLVSNEYDSKRAKVLVENVERNGAGNCIVLNCDTKEIASAFPSFFDAVLCDAPCSGEGMMRKESVAIEQWSKNLTISCAKTQKEILENAYQCLNGGGILVYSTCTLNLEENEKQILDFLQTHSDMEIMDTDVSFGRKGLMKEAEKAIRIFPMDQGEGHFIAKMQKKTAPITASYKLMKSDPIPSFVLSFLKENLDRQYPYYFCKKDRVYGGTFPFIDMGRCRLLRHQVYLGEIKKDRFEPSHAYFLSSYAHNLNTYEMNDEETLKYLHGEQISGNVQKGWVMMCYHGYGLGGSKSDGKVMKNHYPKNYRIR